MSFRPARAPARQHLHKSSANASNAQGGAGCQKNIVGIAIGIGVEIGIGIAIGSGAGGDSRFPISIPILISIPIPTLPRSVGLKARRVIIGQTTNDLHPSHTDQSCLEHFLLGLNSKETETFRTKTA